MGLTCRCEEITAEVIQCEEHHHLWKGGRRLKSVGSIIRESFPLDPSIPPEVLENAMIRGREVDQLFCEYVKTGRLFVPKGTMRQDSRDLLMKLVVFYDNHNFNEVHTQVLLGDSDHGGVLDLRFDGIPTELKATHEVNHEHRLQVAGYARLDGKDCAQILHVTERYAKPKLEPITRQDFEDWDVLLAHYRMVRRRAA